LLVWTAYDAHKNAGRIEERRSSPRGLAVSAEHKGDVEERGWKRYVAGYVEERRFSAA